MILKSSFQRLSLLTGSDAINALAPRPICSSLDLEARGELVRGSPDPFWNRAYFYGGFGQRMYYQYKPAGSGHCLCPSWNCSECTDSPVEWCSSKRVINGSAVTAAAGIILASLVIRDIYSRYRPTQNKRASSSLRGIRE